MPMPGRVPIIGVGMPWFHTGGLGSPERERTLRLHAPVAGLDDELDAARLRLHHDATPSSVAAAALAGLVLAALLRPAVPADVLVGWLCALAVALMLRQLVRRAHGHAGDATPPRTWLLRYRAGFLIHGLVWLSLGMAVVGHLDAAGAALVMVVFAAMAGGALVTAAFDRVAGALFALPALVPVMLRLLAAGGQAVQGTAALLAWCAALLAITYLGYSIVSVIHQAWGARLGGDEFGILLENCPAQASERIAEALRKSVQDLRFIWNGRPFAISVSIGLVQISEGHSSLESLLRTADMACYSAKEKGRNRVHAFQPDDSELSLRVGEMSWVQCIHTALQEDRFCLYAQKIIALRDEVEGVHVEILLRLQDEHGQNTSFLLWAVHAEAKDPELLARAAQRHGHLVVDYLPVRRLLRQFHAPALLVSHRSAGERVIAHFL